MPAKFHPVSPAVWDRTMRELPIAAQVVRCYVLTCPSRGSEGLFTLPVGHIAHDTGLDTASVVEALDVLNVAGLVTYDAQAEVVLDRTALKFTPLRNSERGQDKRIPGAVRQFTTVPDSPLKREMLSLAEEYSPDLHAALVAEMRERHPLTPAEVASVFAQGPSDAAEAPYETGEAPSRDEPENEASGEVSLAPRVGAGVAS